MYVPYGACSIHVCAIAALSGISFKSTYYACLYANITVAVREEYQVITILICVSSLLLPKLPCRAHLASKLCHLWFRGSANVAHISVALFCCTDLGCLQRHIIFGSPTNPLDCTFGTELSRIEFVRSGPLSESKILLH